MPSRRDGRACLVAFAGYAVFFTAFFWQSLTTGELIAPSDALDFGVAGYQAAPSLWTQGLYSGYPIAADPQSLIFYPLLELFRVLGIGWNLFMVAPFIVAATGSAEPLVLGEDVQAGSHVDLLGNHSPDRRECDTELVVKSCVFVDYTPNVVREAGELLIPRDEGRFSMEEIFADLAACCRGVAGRQGTAAGDDGLGARCRF